MWIAQQLFLSIKLLGDYAFLCTERNFQELENIKIRKWLLGAIFVRRNRTDENELVSLLVSFVWCLIRSAKPFHHPLVAGNHFRSSVYWQTLSGPPLAIVEVIFFSFFLFCWKWKVIIEYIRHHCYKTIQCPTNIIILSMKSYISIRCHCLPRKTLVCATRNMIIYVVLSTLCQMYLLFRKVYKLEICTLNEKEVEGASFLWSQGVSLNYVHCIHWSSNLPLDHVKRASSVVLQTKLQILGILTNFVGMEFEIRWKQNYSSVLVSHLFLLFYWILFCLLKLQGSFCCTNGNVELPLENFIKSDVTSQSARDTKIENGAMKVVQKHILHRFINVPYVLVRQLSEVPHLNCTLIKPCWFDVRVHHSQWRPNDSIHCSSAKLFTAWAALS